MRDYVHSLIVAEMRSFAPGDYLAHMPYPELKFKSPALKVLSPSVIVNMV